MIRIIKAELNRFAKGRGFIICIALTIICLITHSFNLFGRLQSSLGLIESTDIGLPDGYSVSFASSYTSIFMFVVPFLIVSIIGSDIGSGAVCNLFGRGIKRRTIFIAKYLTFAIVVFALIVSSGLVSAVLSTVVNKWGPQFHIIQVLRLISTLSLIAFSQIAFSTIPILIALIVQSEALVVILYFVWSLIESILASVMNGAVAKHESMQWIAKLFFTNFSSSIESLNIDKSILPYAAISIVCSIIACLTIGTSIFSRKELM